MDKNEFSNVIENNLYESMAMGTSNFDITLNPLTPTRRTKNR